MITASTTAYSPQSMRRQRMADLTSGIGALVLGIGLGALLADRLTGAGLWLLIIGGVAHAWGMYDKHRIESSSGVGDSWWSAALYWACWVLLVVGALLLSGKLFKLF